MKARYSILSRRVTDDTFETVGVLVLGKRLKFVATRDDLWEVYGRQIEAAAERHKENNVTLDEIFDYYVERGLGPVEAWSDAVRKEGTSEIEIGQDVLASAEYTEGS